MVRPLVAALCAPPPCRARPHAGAEHHDHTKEHPRPGMKAQDAAVPVPEQQHRSSWHQTYRPPI